MPETPPEAIIEAASLRYRYRGSANDALSIPSLRIRAGERVFLRGASGSGKSTLLGLLAGVMIARAGSLRVLGNDMTSLSTAQRDRLRADDMGVVFQLFNLVNYLSVADNIALPVRMSRQRRAHVAKAGGIAAETTRLMSALGLDEALRHRPAQRLSVGQQQRVGLARALIGAPRLILADEPTSALDVDVRDRFMDLLLSEVARAGSTLVFVSHDPALAAHFDRVVELEQFREAVS